MPSPLVENVDVFFPGQGDTLAQAPAYHWERTEAPSEVSAKEGLSEQNRAPGIGSSAYAWSDSQLLLQHPRP